MPVTDAATPRSARGRVPRLVAHRGYPLQYPENSVRGMRAALAAGATAVECDVQLSADHKPMVLHDADLQRTAAIAGDVRELTAAELARVEVNETARFGARFTGIHIPRLHEIAALAREYPAATFFLDVKRASLRRFGSDVVLDAILAEIATDSPSWVIVSFDRALVERSRSRSSLPVGWVVDRWDQVTSGALHMFDPDFAFCSAENTPPEGPLPGGRWQWVIYGVDDPAAALAFGGRGAGWIETDAIGEMLAAPLLRAPAPRP